MMCRIRLWDGFEERECWPTPCKFFVITKGLPYPKRPRFTLTHTTTGFSMGTYSNSKRLLRLYAAIFAGWNVPWGQVRTQDVGREYRDSLPPKLREWARDVCHSWRT